MNSFWILGVFLLLSVAELKGGTSASVFSCEARNLTVMVDDYLRLYIDGIEMTDIPNADSWSRPDVVDLPCTSRLIAIHGRNGVAWQYGGILASTDDEYVLTNSNSSWKCSNVSNTGWEEIDFDDSAWLPAIAYDRNEESSWKYVPGISTNAFWVWLRQYNGMPNSTYEEMDMEVYCRKILDTGYCLSSPCAFGGTCIDETDGGYCICAPGYSGQDCSVVINYCESDPCVNGGSCLPIVNGYVCQCPPGYTDDHCEEVTNNCASFPCLNGGTCFNGINDYLCVCPPEWTGIRCDTLLNPCGSHLCPNGGTCLNYCGEPQCVCAPEWTGTLCLTHIDPCASNLCQNGGSCQDAEDGWICTCPPYFTGLYCEQIIDLCASSPCLNGGTCVFDCGVYQCFCPAGWTGKNCQSLVFLSVVELEAISAYESSCPKRNLTVTVDNYMRLYFDGAEITGLPNADIGYRPDVVELPCTTRLIAIHGTNGPLGAGILASTDDEYILTNSTWKCSNVSQIGWEQIGFDDSAWVPAVELNVTVLPDFSSEASWIWLRAWISDGENMDMEVYCRKILDPNFCAITSPCAFGGTCIDEPNGEYQCICAPGYTGQNCSSALNPCGSHVCLNGGTCVNNCGQPQCICAPGWTGTLCLTPIDPCASNPCQNGGSCQDVEDDWTCTCPQYFTGFYCEQIIDLCASSPCQNGGSCVFDCGVYQCFCPAGWTGKNCQSLISACNPNPCLNGGTCSDLGGDSFTCTCEIYWTGLKCESPNYDESLVCGTTLTWSQYNASNGFTRLCYFWPPLEDIDGRNTECRYTINGIPLYDDYVGLLTAGGNFGCIVSQNYPEDLPISSELSCADNYQQDVSLGNITESARLMVCIRYPYEGVPGRK